MALPVTCERPSAPAVTPPMPRSPPGGPSPVRIRPPEVEPAMLEASARRAAMPLSYASAFDTTSPELFSPKEPSSLALSILNSSEFCCMSLRAWATASSRLRGLGLASSAGAASAGLDSSLGFSSSSFFCSLGFSTWTGGLA